MTRVIAGRYGGRRLSTPSGQNTRPTSDRVREAIFSTLESRWGDLDGAAFLDLYAGSGAVGFEAASRGATRVVCVDENRRAAQCMLSNRTALGAGEVEVIQSSVRAVLGRLGPGFDVAFIDPPYEVASAEVSGVVALAAGLLVADGVLVVERSSRSPELGVPDSWGVRRKKYGETLLWYLEPGQPNSAALESGGAVD